jgi:alpha-N-arabinofuranosidase
MKLWFKVHVALAVFAAVSSSPLPAATLDPTADTAAMLTCTNPIIPGFHPDPSICRVGEDYYLVNSTFEYFPGVPIFQSKDLVHWRQLGYVLARKSQLNLDKMHPSGGIFAPTLRYHDGTFYMVTTLVWGNGGNFYVTATNAAGPWSDPIWLDREGFDPSLFFDDDGKVYYTRHQGEGDGFIGQRVLDPKTGRFEGPLKEIWKGAGGQWPEGPHLYKIQGRYYLMIAEGGTSYDHRVTIARSDSPWGPFEADPANPILTHRLWPDQPFQALGHADLVETPAGWWLVCLGIRPQGGKFHHLGRETLLAPVTWENGWPVVNGGKPVMNPILAPRLAPHPWPPLAARDEFDASSLQPCWSFVRNPDEKSFSLTARPGWLRLNGSAVSLNDQDSPAFIGRRQTDLACRASARLSFEPRQTNEEAGLVVRGNDRNHYEIGLTLKEGRPQVFFKKVLDGQVCEPVRSEPAPPGDLILTVKATPSNYQFFFRPPEGGEQRLGAAPTRELSSEVISSQKNSGLSFTGVFIGMYATGNGKPCSVPADFDWFEYMPWEGD